MNDFHDDIDATVRAAMKNIPETVHTSVQSAMEDLRAAMGDLPGSEASEGSAGEVIERQFSVGPQPELVVNGVSGRVAVSAADTSTISVRATKRGSQRAWENTRIELVQEGNRVLVRTKPEHLGSMLGGNLASVDYQIAVPRDTRVEVKAVSAEVSVAGTQRPVAIQTVSGDVSVVEVEGDCSLTTVSGRIMGRRVAGELQLRTTSGDVRLSEADFHSFNLNSVSGDLVIATPLARGEHYLAKTVSGDLRLLVPHNTGATVQMKSVSGEVVSELPAEIIKAGRRSWQGRINGGGAIVEMSSVSGNLRIAASSDTTDAAGAEVASTGETERQTAESGPTMGEAAGETAPTSNQQTAAVLESLARGEITVEEAMARIDALER